MLHTRRSRRILFTHLALGLVAIGLTLRGAPARPISGFAALLDRYYEELAALFPVDAAGSGDSDHRYDSIWQNDISAAHREQEAVFCSRYSEALGRIDRAALSSSDKLSFDVLKWNLQVRREGLAQPTHLLPINQFWGPALTFAQMGSGESLHPFKTLADYRHFIARAVGFSDWVDTAIDNMRQGMVRGIVQPRILMERVLVQYVPLMADDEEKNVFFAPLKHVPAEGTPEMRESLRADYLRAVRGTILPTYARLHAFIKADYLPYCRDTAGIGVLPGGKEMYAYWVRYWTTTDRSPTEIHALGLSEVIRVRSEMERVMAAVGFKGTLPAFLDYVANDPKFAPFTSDEAVLDAYRQIEARLAPALPKFFGTIPKTKFEIRATEKFRAASSSAEYQSGSSDGARPGIFYVPIVDPKLIRTTEMEDLFLHEAIPGHHFQISTVLEKSDLPRFRRYGWNSAYGEGWALYSESLGKELGLYTDPYQYFGMLLDEMHRAVRLVVDTGLHAEGWSRERALQYSAEQEGGAPETYAAEVERYMGAPGQALSYKIGQLKIIELRDYAQKQLGAAFDIRRFHDEVLDEGALPLAVLEARIREWVKIQRTSRAPSP